MKEGKISLREAICIAGCVTSFKILYTSPAAMLKSTGTAAWYMTLISFLTALTFFLLTCALMNRFPQKNILQVFEAVYGKILGKLIGLIFSGYVFYYSCMSLREFLEMIKSYSLPRTPPSIILITFLIVCIIIAYKGLEIIARISYVIFYPALIILALILFLTVPYYNFDYLKPFWGYGFDKTLFLGILRSSAYGEIFVLFLMADSFKNYNQLKKTGVVSMTISTIVPSISLFVYILVFGYAQGSEPLSGIFELSKLIYFNRYFQRVESVFIFMWVITSVVAVSILLYFAIASYCKIFNIKNHKPIILPFVFLMYMIALLPKSAIVLSEVHVLFLRQYSLILCYGIPIFTSLIAIIFRKKDKNAAPKKA